MNTRVEAESKRSFHITDYLGNGIYVLCIAFMILAATKNKNFLTIGNLLLVLQQASPFLIASTGMAMVLMSGGIDLSVGQNMLLSAAVAARTTQYFMKAGIAKADTPLLFILAIIVAACVGGLIGCVNGFTIAKLQLIPFIATLAMQNIARGLALIIMNGQSQTLDGLTKTVNSRIGGSIPMVIIPAIFVLVSVNFVSRYMPFGRRVKAVGRSAENARKIGIKVVKTRIIVHALCGVVVGICGIMSASQLQYVQQSHGSGSEFIIVSGCTLGGVSLFGGKGDIIPGAVVGVLMVQMIVNGLVMMNASPYIYTIARGVIIFLAIMIESIKYKGILR